MSRKLLALIAGLAMFAASCGGGSGGSDSSSAGSEAADDGPMMAAASPLGAFFSEDGGFEEAIEEFSIKVEEGISICMAEQGFEFARTGGGFNDPVNDAQNELTVRQWTEKYGYGISTSFESALNQNAGDPNAEIVFSMGEEERNQWLFALTGQEGFGGINGDGGDIPLEDQGCIGESLIATGAEDVFDGLQTFGDAYEEAEEALFDRREMVDSVDAWSRCMSEDGYANYADSDAPQEDIGDRFQAILAPFQAEIDKIDPEDGASIFSGDTVDAEALPGLDVEALRTLQDDEIATAIADLDCYDEHVKEIYEPLRDDLERGLMTEYETELDSFKNIGS